jgi:ribonucleoside-diphosphate reductase subunit M1
MKRVQSQSKWTLFCPQQYPELSKTHGHHFDALYESYEKCNMGVLTLNAQDLWTAILEKQIETGGPSLMYKDSANGAFNNTRIRRLNKMTIYTCTAKSNQSNLGIVQTSDPSSALIQYTSPSEPIVCASGSLVLPQFMTSDNKFRFDELHRVTKHLAFDLNRIIDLQFYPSHEARASNLRSRPIGISVQGLADVFLRGDVEYDSHQARLVNYRIFETIYHAALDASCQLARIHGTYECWHGSPAQEGRLQFDLWNHSSMSNDRVDWGLIRSTIKEHGLRNSLLVAPSSNLCPSLFGGYNSSFEAYDRLDFTIHNYYYHSYFVH